MRYRLPDECSGISIAGTTLDPVSDKVVEADGAAAEQLAPHGLVPIDADALPPRETSLPKKRSRP